MRIVFMFLTFVMLLDVCKGSQPAGTTGILVGVKERTLSHSEMNKLTLRGIPSTDSLLLIESFTKKWVKDVLVYDVVLHNLGDGKEEVDKLVEECGRSPVRYHCQEQLVEEEPKADIRGSDKLSYYEENQKKFILGRGLIKGLFLKIPVDALGFIGTGKWYKSIDATSLEKIERYSVQDATTYEYFYDKWVDFGEVMDNISTHVSNPNTFLKANKYVEVADSSYCYLLNIREYLPFNSVESYGYASSHVTGMLVDQRKVESLKKFEDELYNDAIRSGDVESHSEPWSLVLQMGRRDEKDFKCILSYLLFLHYDGAKQCDR